MIRADSNIVEKLIEIKPKYQCKWKKNQAKWKQARKYCAEFTNMEFQVLTEEELF